MTDKLIARHKGCELLQRCLFLICLLFSMLPVLAWDKSEVTLNALEGRTVDGTPQLNLRPVEAEVEVDASKGKINDVWTLSVSELEARSIKGNEEATIENLKSYGIFKSSEKNNCDVIVSPLFDISITSTGAIIKVIGYPGYFKNWNNTKNKDEKREIKDKRRQWFSVNGGAGIFFNSDDWFDKIDFSYDIWFGFQRRCTQTSNLYYGGDIGTSTFWGHHWDYHYVINDIDPTLYVMPKLGINIPLSNIELDMCLGVGFELGLRNWVYNDTYTGQYDNGHAYGIRLKYDIGIWYKKFGVSLSYAPTPILGDSVGCVSRDNALIHRILMNFSYRF